MNRGRIERSIEKCKSKILSAMEKSNDSDKEYRKLFYFQRRLMFRYLKLLNTEEIKVSYLNHDEKEGFKMVETMFKPFGKGKRFRDADEARDTLENR